MNNATRKNFDDLRLHDGETRYRAFVRLLKATEIPVDWAYEVWDDLVEDLAHKDNHRRAIAAQLLNNLARSDPKFRMRRDFEAILAVTRDERFVTARHCLQSIWKVGVAGKKQTSMVLDGLARRFRDCVSEKNCTLIRYDIIVGLQKLYGDTSDETVRRLALQLIETEADVKYRKKYARVWRAA